MNISFKFIEIINHLIILYAFIVFLFENYSNSKITINKKSLIIAISLILSIIDSLFINNLTLLYYIVCVLLLTIVYKYILKMSNNYTIINISLLYIVISFSKMLSFLIINSGFNISLNDMYFDSKLYSIYSITNSIINLITILFFAILVERNKVCLRKIIETLHARDLFLFLILFFSIILPNVLKFETNKQSYDLAILSINIIQLISIFCLVFLYFKYINFYKKSESELTSEKKANENLNDVIDSIRIIKHDYNNILLALNGYIATKQFDQLETHIKKLMKEAELISEKESISPNLINQPAIFGVIDEKFNYAKKKNIRFNLKVLTDISKISFDFADLSRILGILLDNAIEASQKSDSPYVTLSFSYNKYKQANVIEIKNSIAPNIHIDLNKIFEKGESSKKEKSGLGLWKVKKIISTKANSQIYANIENKEFSQTIIIENN